MKWAIHLDRAAVQDLYKIERAVVPMFWNAIHQLAENPDQAIIQSDQDDPSVFWIACEGDIVVHFEILDSEHVIRVLRIK